MMWQMTSCRTILLTAGCILILYHLCTQPHQSEFINEEAKTIDTKAETVPKEEQCHVRTSIYYVKIPKTGSTTTANIMYRFAWSHNLTVFPIVVHKSGSPTGRLMLYGSDQKRKFDIMADHMSFDRPLAQSLMPSDAVFVATIRHPLAWLKSKLAHLRFRRGGSINDTFTNDPVKTLLENAQRQVLGYSGPQDPMIKYLGFNASLRANTSAVQQYIKYLEDTFDAILIAESYDECLLLLKRKFCWNMSDIVYIKERSREYNYKDTVYNESLLSTHRHLSSADYALYNHFKQSLQIKLAFQPQDFWNELNQFRQITKSVSGFCEDIKQELKKDPKVIYIFAQKHTHISVQGVTVSAVYCAILNMEIRILRNILRIRQNPDLCFSNQIQHIHHHNLFDINWEVKNISIHINKLLCSPWDVYYNFPLDVLALNKAYVWQDPGVV